MPKRSLLLLAPFLLNCAAQDVTPMPQGGSADEATGSFRLSCVDGELQVVGQVTFIDTWDFQDELLYVYVDGPSDPDRQLSITTVVNCEFGANDHVCLGDAYDPIQDPDGSFSSNTCKQVGQGAFTMEMQPSCSNQYFDDSAFIEIYSASFVDSNSLPIACQPEWTRDYSISVGVF